MTMHEAYEKILAHFGGNTEKACNWFGQYQVGLGHKTPNSLIQKRQAKKVIEFINRNF